MTYYYPTFGSVPEMVDYVKRSGSSFFNRETMRFWNSRVGSRIYGERFFVTSEKAPGSPRLYTVRFVRDNLVADVADVTSTGFQRFESAREAHREAARLGSTYPPGGHHQQVIRELDEGREFLS